MTSVAIELSIPVVMGMVRTFWWPFLRISSFLMAAPIIGTKDLPRRLRLLFALIMTGVLAPTLSLDPALSSLEPLSTTGLMVVAQQIAVGLSMGLVLRMVFVVFEFAGQIVAQQMGLGFASMVDPSSGVQVPVVGQFYNVLATLIFFGTNLHLKMVQLLSDSFQLLPVGRSIDRNMLSGVVQWSGELLSLAVVMMLPVIIGLLAVNLIFAVMTRAAPQLNVFAIGFPVTLLFGVVIMLLSVPSFSQEVGEAMEAGFTTAYAILGQH